MPLFDPHCTVCKNPDGVATGWLRFDVPVDDPLFGKVRACECRQRAQERMSANHAEALRQQSLTRTERTWTLDNWISSDANARSIARKAVERKFGLYYFWSRAKGTGKSGLLAAMTNSLAGRGVPAKMVVLPDMLDSLRGAYRNNNYDDLLHQLKTVPALMLDEMGFMYEKRGTSDDDMTSWVEEKLYQILDWRYRDWENCLTVFGSNVPPDLLKHERIASRLTDDIRVNVVEVKGEDLRPMARALSGVEHD